MPANTIKAETRSHRTQQPEKTMRLVQQRIADPSALTIVLAPSALTFSIGVVVALLLRSSEHGNHSDLYSAGDGESDTGKRISSSTVRGCL